MYVCMWSWPSKLGRRVYYRVKRDLLQHLNPKPGVSLSSPKRRMQIDCVRILCEFARFRSLLFPRFVSMGSMGCLGVPRSKNVLCAFRGVRLLRALPALPYMYMCILLLICMYPPPHMNAVLPALPYMYMCMCMCNMYVCMYLCMHVCVCMYVCVFVYVCVCVCVCVCVLVCVSERERERERESLTLESVTPAPHSGE
jgi:hypothetical protein